MAAAAAQCGVAPALSLPLPYYTHTHTRTHAHAHALPCPALPCPALQGLRWLGSTARLVSYSTEKLGDKGYRNTLLLTGGCEGAFVCAGTGGWVGRGTLLVAASGWPRRRGWRGRRGSAVGGFPAGRCACLRAAVGWRRLERQGSARDSSHLTTTTTALLIRPTPTIRSCPIHHSPTTHASATPTHNAADVRNRVSTPFRAAGAADGVPLAGLRASPSGRYLLLLFRWHPLGCLPACLPARLPVCLPARPPGWLCGPASSRLHARRALLAASPHAVLPH